ncbi:hypothetical protein CBA19C6_04395 [Cupriavidus pauculus]|nr:hypothetical protein CBA19C6_04395 [Cupriavidus pauculus]
MHASRIGIHGIWLPLVTPFLDNGAFDHAALRRLVARYCVSGLAGFVVCGSTGEAAALEDTEQLAVLAGNHLGHVMTRLDWLGNRPLAGVLAPAPYYIRPVCATGSSVWPMPRAHRSCSMTFRIARVPR